MVLAMPVGSPARHPTNEGLRHSALLPAAPETNPGLGPRRAWRSAECLSSVRSAKPLSGSPTCFSYYIRSCKRLHFWYVAKCLVVVGCTNDLFFLVYPIISHFARVNHYKHQSQNNETVESTRNPKRNNCMTPPGAEDFKPKKTTESPSVP